MFWLLSALMLFHKMFVCLSRLIYGILGLIIRVEIPILCIRFTQFGEMLLSFPFSAPIHRADVYSKERQLIRTSAFVPKCQCICCFWIIYTIVPYFRTYSFQLFNFVPVAGSLFHRSRIVC